MSLQSFLTDRSVEKLCALLWAAVGKTGFVSSGFRAAEWKCLPTAPASLTCRLGPKLVLERDLTL